MKNKQIDQYLLDEMSAAEREKFEDRFFADDELFFEVAERENTLVDRYVRRELEGKKLEKFERSIKDLPARRQKIENARRLQELIADERESDEKAITIAERKGFFSRFAERFSFKVPIVQFAAGALIVVLGLLSLSLLRENRRLGSLEQELAASREREATLESQLENSQTATGDLTRDLDTEREHRQRLEQQIAEIRSARGNAAAPNEPVTPTIATLILPAVGVRGGGNPKRLELPTDATRVSIVVNALADVEIGESLSPRLNGTPLSVAAKVREKDGDRYVTLTIERRSLQEGRNELLLVRANGKDNAAELTFIISTQK